MTQKIALAYANPDEIALEYSVLGDADFELIAAKGGLVTGKPLNDPDIWPLVQDASALLTGLHVVSAEMMDQMPNLQLVTRVGTGYDAINPPPPPPPRPSRARRRTPARKPSAASTPRASAPPPRRAGPTDQASSALRCNACR